MFQETLTFAARCQRLKLGVRAQRIFAFVGILAVATALRFWGLAFGNPVQHPDEIFLVIYPLNLLSGDLNPYDFQKPSLQYYILGTVYLARFAGMILLGSQWDLSQYAAYHYFWDHESLLFWARSMTIAFALANVWCMWRLAKEVYDERAGLIAGLFMAISTLQVRQGFLAAVDVPMTFWFTCAIWASVRLCERGESRHYLLAGVLVGLAAGTKYPGAAAGIAVIAAHFVARRSFWHSNLWISGAAAIGVFITSTPYSLLDFGTFWTHLSYQAQHATAGRGEGVPAWFYHLWISLRYNVGVLGQLSLIAALLIEVLRNRRKKVWVLVAGFVAFLAVVGWGELAFMRYALPLAALQIVLVSGMLSAIRELRLLILILCLVAAEPLYGSVKIAQLASSADTRTEARSWIESNISPGTTCCNFGGWAGDPPVRTFTDHWWRMKTFANSFGRDELHRQIGFLNLVGPQRPFFDYSVHPGVRHLSSGSLSTMKEDGCSYVIIHQHSTSYSTVDSLFAGQLPLFGRVAIQWSPIGLKGTNPRFDTADANYLPIANFGNLQQTGPEIEIWDIARFAETPEKSQTGMDVFARGYALWSLVALDEGKLVEAREFLLKAQELASDQIDVLMAEIVFLRHTQRYADALELCQQVANSRSDWYKIYDAMGTIFEQMQLPEKAMSAYLKALELNPDRANIYNSLAVVVRTINDGEKAMTYWRRSIDIDPNYSVAHYNIGTAHYMRGDFFESLHHLSKSIELDPDNIRAHLNAGFAARATGDYENAIRFWDAGVKLDPENDELCYNIAWTFQFDLLDGGKAIPYWRKVLQIDPEDEDATRYIAEALAVEDKFRESEHWLRRLDSLQVKPK